MKNYELELPDKYKLIKTIDAKNHKTAIIMNILSIFVALIVFIIGIYIYYCFNTELTSEFDNKALIVFLLYFVGFGISIVIHELIHGLFYKIFTKQKLTFGITFSAAFCGVPNIYIKKKAMIITTIAPSIIISLLLLIPLLLVNNLLYFIFILLLFASHLGGCIGDFYIIILLIFKYSHKETLVNDTGEKQNIYVKMDD